MRKLRDQFSKYVNLGVLLIIAGAPLLTPSSSAADPISFRNQIAPILLKNCIACHGPKNAKGNYRLDNYELAVGAGDSASPAFAPKDVDGSEGFRRITSDDPKERMPLEADPLPADQVALIKRWIEEGAAFDGPNPKAALATIVPPPQYADPPAAYPRTLPITAVAFNAAGDELFVAGYHEITVWSPADGRLLRRIKNVGERTCALALSPDGKLLAAAGGAPGQVGEVRLFDPATGNLVRVVGSTSDVVFDAAFSPAGDRLAAAGTDSIIRVFNVADGAQQLAIESHADWVLAIAWSRDGNRLASAARDKSSKVFDAKTGELLVTYSGHGAPVKGVAFSLDGAEVYSAGDDNKLHAWTVVDTKKTGDLATFAAQPSKLFSSGEVLLAPSADKTVREINLKTKAATRSYAGHTDWPLSAAYHAGTSRLATGSFNGEVRVWNTADGNPVTTFVAAPGLAPAPAAAK